MREYDGTQRFQTVENKSGKKLRKTGRPLLISLNQEEIR
jgi:hypothetical protein